MFSDMILILHIIYTEYQTNKENGWKGDNMVRSINMSTQTVFGARGLLKARAQRSDGARADGREPTG